MDYNKNVFLIVKKSPIQQDNLFLIKNVNVNLGSYGMLNLNNVYVLLILMLLDKHVFVINFIVKLMENVLLDANKLQKVLVMHQLILNVYVNLDIILLKLHKIKQDVNLIVVNFLILNF